MVQELPLSQFLKVNGPIFDVRSPGEFLQGRIPGALNLPLLTNEERARIGTCYKQQGREKAVELGFELIGPKLARLISEAKTQLHDDLSATLKIHCWRGGLRSSSMAWLLQTAGFQTLMLKGGYKTFRQWVLESLQNLSAYQLIVLGGMTGSGKTQILHVLKERGEQVLDLEEIACHRGSSYGAFESMGQPSVEQFENEIAMRLHAFDVSRPIWVEDESRAVGTCQIPSALFSKMRNSLLIVVKRPLRERLQLLEGEYGFVQQESLIAATERIRKRLGGALTHSIVELIRQGQLKAAMEKVLSYYDATYCYGLSQRAQKIVIVEREGYSLEQWGAEVTSLKSLHSE